LKANYADRLYLYSVCQTDCKKYEKKYNYVTLKHNIKQVHIIKAWIIIKSRLIDACTIVNKY